MTSRSHRARRRRRRAKNRRYVFKMKAEPFCSTTVFVHLEQELELPKDLATP